MGTGHLRLDKCYGLARLFWLRRQMDLNRLLVGHIQGNRTVSVGMQGDECF